MASNYYETYGVVTVTASTVTITDEGYLGKPIIFNRAAGIVATLPASSGSGNRYECIGLVDASGTTSIAVANATDVMMGVAYLGNDSATASCFYTGDTSDTITFDGSTKGGLKGWRVVLTDIASGFWAVTVWSEASGAEATPFSAAVA